MRYTKRLLILFFVIAFLTVMEVTFPGNPKNMAFYTRYIFRPYQSFRNLLFGYIPISMGDILYCLGAIAIIVLLVRWIYMLIRIRANKHNLTISILHTLIALGSLYILFIIGWGANYYKPALRDYWNIDVASSRNDSSIFFYDRFLIDKLNTYAPHYHTLSFKEINQHSQEYYKQFTDCKAKLSGLRAKPSLFNYWMQLLGIQGYYNPFTGEAQVNKYLPAFVLPFVVCHEMAHQSGVAAEGDANLMAYVVGTAAHDSIFNYSAYLDIWFYVQSRVRMKDSVRATQFYDQLNILTRSQIDTLRAIRKKYEGRLSSYSGKLYDEYLRLHDQKHGIRSYGDVIMTAWAWEQRRAIRGDSVIKIP